MFLLWKYFALGFSALLPLINPLGSALIFLGLVGNAPIDAYPPLARKIAINTIIFLAVVQLIGIYLRYADAPKLTSALAPSTAHGILRVIAFILLCIGVQIAWNGLSSLLEPLLNRQQIT